MTEHKDADSTDHIPAPAEHAPRKETFLLPDAGQIIVAEVDNLEHGWLQGDSVAVEQ
jgi:hypothetical protein